MAATQACYQKIMSLFHNYFVVAHVLKPPGPDGRSLPSPPESRSMVSATTTMGLRSTWARTNTWNSSRLSYTGSSELSTLHTHTRTHTHTHVYKHKNTETHAHTNKHTHRDKEKHTHTENHKHRQTNTAKNTHIHTHILCVHPNTHTETYRDTHTDTHMFTQTYTHTHKHTI